jgi:2-amino-4-hydroxy-6-hydroxymethyldihydropteridine diphosphokinase
MSANIEENNRVYLGLSSNLKDREKNLEIAKEEISQFAEITKCSSLYETEPVGYKNQGNFLNIALELKTDLTAIEIIVRIQEIEHKMGRVREIQNGPRIIDIDILLFNSEIKESKNLTIPHPRMEERNFVLKPLAEIAGELVHPKLNTTIENLRKNLINPDKAELWTKKK